MHVLLNIVSLSFLVMVEVQISNLLSEEECRAIFGDYGKWESNLLQASLRAANTTLEVGRILQSHQFSGESRTLKGTLFVDVCEVGIALKCLSLQLPLYFVCNCIHVYKVLSQFHTICEHAQVYISECLLRTISSCLLGWCSAILQI